VKYKRGDCVYNDFARIYDKLQPETEYEKFADYMEAIFAKFGKSPQLMLDLACGTGRLTSLLAKRGYDMIGIDISSDALEISTARVEKQDILYLQQDMTDFELYGTVDAIVCCFDSINYITNLRDLKKCFKLCKNYLNPGGLLIFDINTPHKFKNILANNIFTFSCQSEDFEDIFCIWENNYNGTKNEFHLTFFEKFGEFYKKFEETHIQCCYEVGEIKNILAELKMQLKGCYHEFSFKAPRKNSERIFLCFENIC
jgi:SAM-dependent methyltransferase